jgi:hypothetical protein
MPLFVCDKCGCVDNTALGGTWWTRNTDIWKPEDRGKALCTECAPPEFSDGSPNVDAGKWHNRFPKEKYNERDRDNVLNPPK